VSLAELRFRWLIYRGYRILQYIHVAHSWDGERPPAYGYYMKVSMIKGLTVKTVKFSNFSSPQDLRVALEGVYRKGSTGLKSKV
jgi:hypothetical protein